MTSEPYRGSIHIAAEPHAVFEYFVNPGALIRWMGDEAVLDPRPGRAIHARHWGQDSRGPLSPRRAPAPGSYLLGAAGVVETAPSGEHPRGGSHGRGRRNASHHRPLRPARLGIDPARARLAALLQAPPDRSRGWRPGASRGATLSDSGRRLGSSLPAPNKGRLPRFRAGPAPHRRRRHSRARVASEAFLHR